MHGGHLCSLKWIKHSISQFSPGVAGWPLLSYPSSYWHHWSSNPFSIPLVTPTASADSKATMSAKCVVGLPFGPIYCAYTASCSVILLSVESSASTHRDWALDLLGHSLPLHWCYDWNKLFAVFVSMILYTNVQTILLLQLKQAWKHLEGKSFACNIECMLDRTSILNCVCCSNLADIPFTIIGIFVPSFWAVVIAAGFVMWLERWRRYFPMPLVPLKRTLDLSTRAGKPWHA